MTAPPDPRDGRFRAADALLLVTAAIWGVNFAVVKFALAALPPLAMNAVRFLAASAAVGLALRLSGRRWDFARRDLPALAPHRLGGGGLLGGFRPRPRLRQDLALRQPDAGHRARDRLAGAGGDPHRAAGRGSGPGGRRRGVGAALRPAAGGSASSRRPLLE